MLSNYYKVSEDEAIKKAEDFSNKAKDTFIKSPAQMKLLIVVDKLLT
jgi:type I restriction enzyme R subunit